MRSNPAFEGSKAITFSVVIPLYNKREQIGETVAGVLAQTRGDFELVIIDDGSTDGSADVVEAIADTRIRLIRQQNQGAAAARNNGWRAARGSFVAFLDGDDQWDDDYLSTLAGLITAFPECGGYATGYRRRSTDGVIANRLEAGLSRAGRGVIADYFLSATLGDQPFYTSTICVRREVLEQLGGFLGGVTHGEDLDLWGRVALHHSIAFDPVAKATYRLDAGNRAMRKCPPLGWVFRTSVSQFRDRNPDAAVSPALQRHVEHIELYHAALNLPFTSGARIRKALGAISWTNFPLRKGKIWLASFVIAKSRNPFTRRVLSTDRRRRRCAW